MSKAKAWGNANVLDDGVDVQRLNEAIALAKKPTAKPKPGRELADMNVPVPAVMLKKLKIAAIDRGITLRELVEQVLREAGWDE